MEKDFIDADYEVVDGEGDKEFPEIERDVWRISEFTKKLIETVQEKFPDETISVHYNTVDMWFKEMEEMGVHYVNRAKGEKVYDSQDLKIAEFMFLRRKENFAKSIIYEMIPRYCETRPFPKNYGEEFLPDSLRNVITGIVSSREKEIEERLERKINELYRKRAREIITEELKREQRLLQDPEREKKKEAELTAKIIQRHLQWEKELEEEALRQWNLLDEKKRTIKVGLFRRIENSERKHAFIREYVRENILKRLENPEND